MAVSVTQIKIISMLLEMQHSFLRVTFSSPALITLYSPEFSCMVKYIQCISLYLCGHVCMYTINCRNVRLQMASIHSQHATLFRCCFSVFAIKCYINVAIL